MGQQAVSFAPRLDGTSYLVLDVSKGVSFDPRAKLASVAGLTPVARTSVYDVCDHRAEWRAESSRPASRTGRRTYGKQGAILRGIADMRKRCMSAPGKVIMEYFWLLATHSVPQGDLNQMFVRERTLT